LVGEPVESTVQRARNFLCHAHRNMRRRRHNCLFFLFQKGGPLSAVPAILAGGAAIMAVAGIMFFHETPSWQRLVGITLAVVGLFLLRR